MFSRRASASRRATYAQAGRGASQGIDKNLAHQARVLGALSDEKFEQTVAASRDAVVRAVRTVIQIAEVDQERERAAQARTESGRVVGCTIEDLERLAASGYRAGAIVADPPSPFATWSHHGLAGDATQENRRPRSRAAPYKTMTHEDIYKLPVANLAAKNCVLVLWVVQTQLPEAVECLRRWDFEFKSVVFAWFKGEEDAEIPIGTGYWTRAGFEQCWLATRGNPRRLHADVRQVILEPRREHSRKPDCVFERVERLVSGPYLELFARPTSAALIRPGWICWGDEIPRDQFGDAPPTDPAPPAAPEAREPDPLDIPDFLLRRAASLTPRNETDAARRATSAERCVHFPSRKETTR
jgi:N6-adenosine-specific RNA methylase IME4